MIFKEQLETKDEKINRLEKELYSLKQEKKMLEKLYNDLITRYRKQNDEVLELKTLLSKEVENGEN